ncbi:MAG: DUF2164 domain-containing protein [Planctomycetota bacterium]
MAIEYEPQTKADLIEALRAYVLDNLDRDMGDLQAGTLFEFVDGLVGAAAYNRGVADAQAWLTTRILDMPADLHESVDYGS